MNPDHTDTQRGLIAWFARNPVAANLMMISVIVMGIMSLSVLRKESFPSRPPDTITISMTYDSGSPQQAEEGIALKIEDALETVTGIKHITSESTADGSTVSVEAETGYDMELLLTEIKTKVDAVYNFPSDAENAVIEEQQREHNALWIQLHGDTDRATLQTLTERLKSDLLAQNDIRDVNVVGVADRMMSIEVDEARLQAYGLDMSTIADAINNNSTLSLTTSLRSADKILWLKASDQAYQESEFSSIPLLTESDGTRITLADVATVREIDEDDPTILSRFQGQNSTGIQVVMDDMADITKLVEQAQQVVEDWKTNGQLPANVNITSWYDGSTLITDRLEMLVKNASSGILLVFLVLALFLDLRVAFWVAAGLPFVFFGTLYFMTDTYVGLTINEMTTFGFILALGIVVDDAVVIGESVHTTRHQYGDTLENTIWGTQRVAIPTVFGVLTTIAAFVALSNVEGGIGNLYSQFAGIVSIALGLSLVESKFILPAHLAHLKTLHKEPGLLALWAPVQRWATHILDTFNQRFYQPLLQMVLVYRYAAVGFSIAILLFVMGMPNSGMVRFSFFPDLMDDVVNVELSMQKDASYGQTAAALNWIEQKAHEADQQLTDTPTKTYIQYLQVVSDADLSGSMIAQIDQNASYTPKEFATRWQQLVGLPEGVRRLAISASRRMVNNFQAEITAWDDTTAEEAGRSLKEFIAAIPGVSGIDDNLDSGEPQISFELNAQGRSLGLSPSELSRQVLQVFGGEIVQRYQRGKDEIKVRVRYPQQSRETIGDILNAKIRTGTGEVVPLNSVAKLQLGFQPDTLTRIDGERAVYIAADVDKSQIASNELVTQVKNNKLPELMRQYPGIRVSFTGEAEQQEETMSSMNQMFILALLAIYVLLAVPLKSYGQPILIMLAIPFGIVGAILGHWINDLTLSLLSLNGILALSGVVVNDSLLLVSTFNDLKTKELQDSKDILVEACTSRLRAVLLTSATTYLGLVPLLKETSFQAQFLIPAAASLGYGILFATAITLLIIPCMMLIQIDLINFLGQAKSVVLQPFRKKS